MSLMLIIFLYLFNFSLLSIDSDQIFKGQTKSLSSPRGFIDLSDFNGYYRIHYTVTVKNGRFDNKYLYIGGSLIRVSSWSPISFPTGFSYDSEEYGQSIGNYYSYHTLHFYTPVDSSWNFYYIKFPSPSYYSGYDYTIEVEIENSGIPVAVVWVLSILVVAIIVGVIFFVRRRKRLAYASNPPVVITQPNPVYNPPGANYVPPTQPINTPQTLY